MTLLSILLTFALEYFLGALDRVRNYAWFDAWVRWLEGRCAGKSFWDGPAGAVLTLAVPLGVLALAGNALAAVNILAIFLLATAVLIYSLGPDLNSRLDEYIAALQSGDESAQHDIESQLLVGGVRGEDERERMIRSILLRSHEQLFGVLFWFTVLGMTGALLFCLVVQLRRRSADAQGGYVQAVRDLHQILCWPSARLEALGFALAGNLVDALDGWRAVGDAVALDASDELLGSVGVGALHVGLHRAQEEEGAHPLVDGVSEAQALINRTLVIWLIALGFMTIGNWIG
jgi:membrane protein required for beta-lactamase induction